MTPVAEHRAHVLEAVLPLAARMPEVVLPLTTATGHLSRDLVARVNVPPWDNSAMDGYAVRSADLAPLTSARTEGVRLRIVADIPAGSGEDPPLGPGEAARIMTGAPVPSDADAVVQLELTDRDDPSAPLAETVTVKEPVVRGRHVRQAGGDRAVGDLVAAAGTRLTSTVRAALASAGYGEVPVRATPRVAVVATGSELREPGTLLTRGQIPDSNSLLVAGLVAEHGGEIASTERVSDDPRELAEALRRLTAPQERIDVVILTGGVSAGAFDPVKQLFADSRDVAFTKVAMQPGKPQAFGVLPGGRGGRLVLFGLPGNPVSAWVSFQMFVRPALAALAGRPEPLLLRHPATVTHGWARVSGRDQVLPARIELGSGGFTVAPVAALGSSSHLVASLALANGYAYVPAAGASHAAGPGAGSSTGPGDVAPGDNVEVVLTRELT